MSSTPYGDAPPGCGPTGPRPSRVSGVGPLGLERLAPGIPAARPGRARPSPTRPRSAAACPPSGSRRPPDASSGSSRGARPGPARIGSPPTGGVQRPASTHRTVAAVGHLDLVDSEGLDEDPRDRLLVRVGVRVGGAHHERTGRRPRPSPRRRPSALSVGPGTPGKAAASASVRTATGQHGTLRRDRMLRRSWRRSVVRRCCDVTRLL